MRKGLVIAAVIVAVLLIVRLLLPGVIRKVINKNLADMKGYKGEIRNVDLRLYRGAYIIDSLTIVSVSDTVPVPFISIRKLDLSVHWKSLLHGKLVGKILFDKPVVNFAVTGQDTTR